MTRPELDIRPDDIAVVGMSGRFPGAPSVGELWRALRSGREGISAFSDEELAAAGVPRELREDPAYVPARGVLDEETVRSFDDRFFDLSPREVATMDPQQRLFLECCWEALEDAGHGAGTLEAAAGGASGVRAGVYAGSSVSDYLLQNLHSRLGVTSAAALELLFGNDKDYLATRVSYRLDLRGPALTVQTACSTSLVAIHLACQGLLERECDLALAGGVSINLPQRSGYLYQEGMILSPDGHCRPFDAQAGGTVQGNGVGVLVLKRLEDAVADRDPIRAVIKGTAINNDGALKVGYTAPSVEGQAEVIEEALAVAGVEAASVGYIEAHGTGTAMGDPIEIAALHDVFGGGEPGSIALGAIKSNVGHLGAAAGVAGVIKAILALQHGEIPPSLHFEEPNPEIDFGAGPFRVADELRPWPAGEHPRRAGVSSFGVGGTNAHAVLEEAPRALLERADAEAEEGGALLLPLSARSPEALRELAGRWSEALGELEAHGAETAGAVADACYTASVGRAALEHRLAVAGDDGPELVAALERFSHGEEGAGVELAEAPKGRGPEAVFLFPGQGAQRVGVGRELYEREPVFREVLDRCDGALRGELERPLLEVIFGTGSAEEDEAEALLRRTEYAQPALYALEVALATLWRSWGVEPAAVLGHSVGEIAAAAVAGAFSIEDGLRLIAARGRLMGALPAGGAMASLVAREGLREALGEVIAEMNGHGQALAVAADNGAGGLTLSGEEGALDAALSRLAERGFKGKRLSVSHAFHSALMEPMQRDFAREAERIEYRPTSIELVSCLTGERLGPGEMADAAHWVRHVREAVQFGEGMATLADSGHRVFLEVGPGTTLSGMGRRCLEEVDATGWQVSLRPRRPERRQMLTALGGLWTRGVAVDWSGVYSQQERRRLALPTYPFQRREHWIEPETAGRAGAGTPAASVRRGLDTTHPLLGARLRSPLRQVQYETVLDGGGELSFLDDHRIADGPVLPATAYLEAALAAGRDGATWPAVEDLAIHEALTRDGAGGSDGATEARTVQVIVDPSAEGGGRGFEISSAGGPGDQGGEEWRLHARGRLVAGAVPSDQDVDQAAGGSSLEELEARCSVALDPEAYYRTLAERGLSYGPAFQGIRGLWRAPLDASEGGESDADGEGGEALARIEAPEPIAGALERYLFHPALLDACLQPVGAALGLGGEGTDRASLDDAVYLPLGVDRLVVHRRPEGPLWSHVRLREAGAGSAAGATVTADYRVLDEEGEVIARLEGLRLKRSSAAVLRSERIDPGDWLYEVAWRRQPRPALPEPLPVRPVGEIAREAATRLPALRAEHELAVFDELEPALDRLCAAHARSTFERLGVTFEPGRRLDGRGLADELGVVERHRRLFHRLLEMLVEDGLLLPEEGDWRVAEEVPEATDPESLASTLEERFPQGRSVLRLIGRSGPGLASVLRGEEDPLELLFPGGDATAAEDLYERSPAARGVNALVREAVSSVVRDLPAGRPLRVLEIGAGTGGTTAALVDALPEDRTDYLYTDLSPRFTARAAEKLGHVPFMRFRPFDVEGDSALRDLGGERFDLVIAANVLHATRDLSVTLDNVRRLLAPGGVLIMVEATGRQRWADVTFGMTEGWWLFEDRELRPDYPLLQAPAWCTLLGKVGFEEAVALPGEEDRKAFPRQAVLLASAPTRSATQSEQTGSWLILGDGGGLGERLAAELEARGRRTVLVGLGDSRSREGDRITVDPSRPEDFRWLVDEVTGDSLEAAVHLAALDAPSPEEADLAALDAAQRKVCGSALHLTQALAALGGGRPRLTFVTRGAQAVAGDGADPVQAPLWGLGRVVGLEHPELACTRIDLDPAGGADDLDDLVGELLAPGADPDRSDRSDREDQVGFRAGERRVARLVRSARSARGVEDRQPFRLLSSTTGTLDGVRREPLERRPPGAGEVEVEVRAAGVNFKDVLNALGMFGGGAMPLGGECAGTVVRVGDGVVDLAPGDRVIALAPGCFGSFVTTRREFVAQRPEGLSAAAAASLPMAFLTARYGLAHLAALRSGERVLIHSASGGVGLAAIQVARAVGAEVLATAGTPAKRRFLHELGIEHVMDSRTVEFADRVLEVTDGRGVDVVLNSLTGEAIRKGLEILAPGGRFVEIGRTELWTEAEVRRVRDDVSYLSFDLAQEALASPEIATVLLGEMEKALADGWLRPLPHRCIPMDRGEEALRSMQQARHVGKLVLTLAPPAAEVRADATYLVTGGLGGLGLLVARWLADRGARHLVLVGRSGAATDAARETVAALEGEGVEVVVERADVADADTMGALLDRLEQSMPPIRGVIHAAGVLDDGVLAQQSWERFDGVLRPKVHGGWSLHRGIDPEQLDLFVLFSSTASLLGSPGQANHAAANAFLDALAERRHAAGLPALAIDWGAWAEVGAVVDRGVDERLAFQGMRPIPPELGLRLLGELLAGERPRVGVLSVDWSRLAAQLPAGRTPYLEEVDRPGGGESAGADGMGGGPDVGRGGAGREGGAELRRLLDEAPAGRRRAVLREAVRDRVVAVLRLDPSEPIDSGQPLDTLGLDSLIAVELRNALAEVVGATLPATLLFDYPTIDGLTDHLADEVLRLEAPAAGSEPSFAGSEREESPSEAPEADLSDEEAEELLAEELAGIDRLLGDA